MKNNILLIIVIGLAAIGGFAQSSGTFDLSHRVVAGGGSNSTGGAFRVDGTAGQNAAGTTSANGAFNLQGGFWFQNLAPTAASVSIAGRVNTPDGSGLRNAVVTLTDSTGNARSTRTGTFGYYRFEGIEAGQTVVLAVISRRFQFEPRVLTVNEDLANVDFTAIGENF